MRRDAKRRNGGAMLGTQAPNYGPAVELTAWNGLKSPHPTSITPLFLNGDNPDRRHRA